MKKLIIFSVLVFIAAFVFAQNIRTADFYKNAETLVQEAVKQQQDGYYQESMSTSETAETALDSAILDAYQVLMQTKTANAKTGADAQIDTVNKLGIATDAQFKTAYDNAIKSYNDVVALLKPAAEQKAGKEAIVAAYNPIIEGFNSVTNAVKQIYDNYMAREKQNAGNLIAGAKTRYNDLLTKRILVKGSGDDNRVTTPLNAADTALTQNNFPQVQTNVKTAQDTMTQIESAFTSAQAQTKKMIDDATARFNQLKTAKIIAPNSADEKNIAGLLASAQTAYDAATFPQSQQSANNAVTAMNTAENNFKTAQASAQKAIADATAKQQQLNTSGVMSKESAENVSVTKLIADANTAFKAGDNTVASKNATDALTAMNTLEQNYTALLKSVQDLIAQAKSGQSVLATQYPSAKEQSEYVAISNDITSAEKDVASKLFEPAKKSAQDALEKIAQFKSHLDAQAAAQIVAQAEKAALYTADGKFKVLPKYYTVVSRVPVSMTDCMWRIASYEFIYNDKEKWTPIYDLNKTQFPKPNNPNLIYPGQILEIPSLNGEKREGMYDPKIKYASIDEVIKK